MYYLALQLFLFSFFACSFQPTSTAREVTVEKGTLQQHHLAVQQRVRALLNVPDHVTVHTSGQATVAAATTKASNSNTSNNICMGVVTTGLKRKLSPTTPVVPLTPVAEVTEAKSETLNSGVGMELLQKFGWKEGTSLGKHTTQANAPIIPIRLKDRAGLGSSSHVSATVGKEGTVVTTIIDEELDSEKTKAWKRMMARFSEPR